MAPLTQGDKEWIKAELKALAEQVQTNSAQDRLFAVNAVVKGIVRHQEECPGRQPPKGCKLTPRQWVWIIGAFLAGAGGGAGGLWSVLNLLAKLKGM